MSDLDEKPIEELLHEGNTVICYDCPTEIKKGDKYYVIDGKMYCEDCGEEAPE